MAENYAFRMKDESLSHHGIEGQKWGVRNGPPYPIQSGDHSAAEKRAMRKNYRAVKKTKLIRNKRTNPLNNKTVADNVSRVLHERNEEMINFFKSDADLGAFQSLCNNVARDCLGKYSNKQIYAKVKGVFTDFGVAKYGTVHNIGSAEEVLGRAIYEMYLDLVRAPA